MKVPVNIFKIVCDCCGETFETGDGFECFTDDPDGSLIQSEAIDSNWLKVGDEHFCDACYEIDDHDDFIIKNGRKISGETGLDITDDTK